MCAVENKIGVAGAARPGAAEQGGLAPKTGARIYFELEKEKDLASLTIRVRDDRMHINKVILLKEKLDKEYGDLVVDMYMNDEFVLRAAEGPETPWFFNGEDLTETIRNSGELWTYKQVIQWFKNALDELEEEVRE